MDIIILLDSGSSHTFLSEKIAEQLHGVKPEDNILQVKVANGDVLK